MNGAHKTASWGYLFEDLSCQLFPEPGVPHFCSPPSAPFRGGWKSPAVAAGFIPRRGIWQALWQLPICIWQSPMRMCLVAQLCLTLCYPMDCSMPGLSVHGDSLGKTTEWVAMLSSRGSSQTRDQTPVSWTAGRFFTTEPSGKTNSSPAHSIKISQFCFKNLIDRNEPSRAMVLNSGCTLRSPWSAF